MRISDWSSDVCSSDLPHRLVETAPRFLDRTLPAQPGGGEDVDLDQQPPRPALIGPAAQAGEFLQRRVALACKQAKLDPAERGGDGDGAVLWRFVCHHVCKAVEDR